MSVFPPEPDDRHDWTGYFEPSEIPPPSRGRQEHQPAQYPPAVQERWPGERQAPAPRGPQQYEPARYPPALWGPQPEPEQPPVPGGGQRHHGPAQEYPPVPPRPDQGGYGQQRHGQGAADLTQPMPQGPGGYPPPYEDYQRRGPASDRDPSVPRRDPRAGAPERGYPQGQPGAGQQQPRRYVEPTFPAQQLFEPAPPRATPGSRLPGRASERAAAPPGTAGHEAVRRTRESTTRIALIYPELLGTYGDGGNAIVLSQRLRWRGMGAEVVSVPAGAAIPAGCDIYLLGGGEDEPQTLAAEGLRHNNALQKAVAGGAVVLAVCAGYQVIGQSFPAGGKIHDGLGLIGVETRRSFDGPDAPLPPRVVGDIALDPHPSLRLPVLLGYENHGGRTRPLPGARGFALGKVRVGLGNGIPEGTDGMVEGRIVGTYLHGPVLAQNPALADLLLTWVHGTLPVLGGPPEVDALRTARIRALQLD